ncbi:hypothetical protein Pta6605_29020 [Pseudomonas amygdali pv. tabaci]|nr:hypothetical protein Pta6605_29020 [Pseudomonas amygdali pv. tabaci]
MAHQCGQTLVSYPYCGLHALIVQIETQRQGIDEDAQRPLRGLGTQQAPHQYSAEDDSRLSGKACQHPCPAQVKQAGDAYSQAPRLSAQALAQQQIKRDTVLFELIAVTAQILQAVRQGRFIEVAEHVAEERFMLFFADAQQRLPDIVAERYRYTQQPGLPRQARLYFMTHHFQRTVVHGDMVEQQRSLHPLTLRRLMADQTHQRCLAQHHGHAFGARRGIDLEFSVTPDHLQRGFQTVPVH